MWRTSLGSLGCTEPVGRPNSWREVYSGDSKQDFGEVDNTVVYPGSISHGQNLIYPLSLVSRRFLPPHFLPHIPSQVLE